jgi:hypothetical protein
VTEPTQLLTPAQVLDEVAQALPARMREQVIIIGSLAAGYHYFAGDGASAIRTKDVDCLFSPHAKAVANAVEVTEQLLRSRWAPRQDARWGTPGTAEQSLEDLPMVRLVPPDPLVNHAQWFIELLSAPPEYHVSDQAKKLRRLRTTIGDFAICSFDFLALVEWEPLPARCGLRIARPEMMALANLLHHPVVSDALIAGTDYKRSNKDLGRVLALAYLTIVKDRRDRTDELAQWPARMWSAAVAKFGSEAVSLATRAGSGVKALLAEEADLAQALRIANLGLLATMDLGMEAFRATGRRLLSEVIEPLVELARS